MTIHNRILGGKRGKNSLKKGKKATRKHNKKSKSKQNKNKTKKNNKQVSKSKIKHNSYRYEQQELFINKNGKKNYFYYEKHNNQNPIFIHKDLTMNLPNEFKGDSLPSYMNNMKKSVI